MMESCRGELREATDGHAAILRIVTIPENVKLVITKAAGGEQVCDAHRTWGVTK
jgi:hypothetical protein